MRHCRHVVEFDEKKIDAIFAEINQCHLPGAAVGIAIGGRPVYRKGFGLANMELPVVLSPSIRMRINSTTKHFTCLAYMLLCEADKAGIDDALGKYFPELHPVTRGVTIHQLMGCTGGLRDAHSLNWQFSGLGRPVSSDDLLSFYRDVDDVNFAPGTCWSYSNGGFLLLGLVIERITGRSLEEVLRERVFDPVGMHDTLLRRYDTDFVPNIATLHMIDSKGAYNRSYQGSVSAGEAGIVSTVDDMLRWMAHMDKPVVGGAATWALMKRPEILANGTGTDYGLGLQSGCYRGVEVLHHAGASYGANSQMLKVPAAGLDVAIMSNRHDVDAALLTGKILDTCLLGLDSIKESSRGPFAAGVFRSSKTSRVVQLFVKDEKQIVCFGGQELHVEPDSEGWLWPAYPFASKKRGVTLTGDTERPSSIRLNDFGNYDELIRIEHSQQPDVRKIIGYYRSDSAGIDATISEVNGSPQLSTVGRFGSMTYDLKCLADGIWRAETDGQAWLGGILLFDCDSGAFRYSNHLIWQLPFRRRA